MTTLQDLQNLARVARERTAQDMKWGVQSHADGTGNGMGPWDGLTGAAGGRPATGDAVDIANHARAFCDHRFKYGAGCWSDILLEEVAEAFAEHEPGKLRAELLQVAAVAVAWVGAIDRRALVQERVYVSGPISGDPDAAEKFSFAAEILIEQGKVPVNPFMVAPLEHPDRDCPTTGYSPGTEDASHQSSACYMRTDIFALLGCDSIHMLEDWWHSRGATVERDVAIAVGMPITYAGDHEPEDVDQ